MLPLKESKLSQKIFEFSNDGILILLLDENRIIDVNPSATKMLGYSREELLTMGISDIHPKETGILEKFASQVLLKGAGWTNEITYKTKSGELLLLEVSASMITVDNNEYLLSLVRNISHRKQIEAQLRMFSFTDGLTGLANRRKLDEYMDIEWRRAMRNELPISMIMIDIDYFKIFNDTYGHLEGDSCLKAVANVIQNSLVRPGDLCARYGGEEFIILLPNTDKDGALHITNRIEETLASERIENINSDINSYVTVSMGVACIVPNSKITSSLLISKADQALYKAKGEGRNKTICLLDSENH